MRVPVWLEGWQYQCCGEEFGVGSTVAWTLALDDDDFARRALGSQAPAWSVALPVLARVEDPSEMSGGGFVVGAEGLHVFVRAASALAPASDRESVLLHLLREDHHINVPDGVPPTRGQVRRIRLVRLGYDWQERAETYRPRPGDAVLQEVDTADKWPADLPEGRRFAAFLVDLDVDRDGDGQQPAL